MPLDTLGSSLGEGEESVCFWVGFAWLGMYINYMLLHVYEDRSKGPCKGFSKG